MLVIPALAATIVFVCLRPHEVFEVLSPLTFNAMAALVAVSYALDARIGIPRSRPGPLLGIGLAYFAFTVLSMAVLAPDKFGILIPALSASAIILIGVSTGVTSLRGFEVVATTVLGITLFLSVIGVEQGLSHKLCYGRGGDETTGRACDTNQDCFDENDPGAEYICEHPGLMGTHSIGGRVRYRGMLKDPNELGWVVALGVPIAFALYERRASAARLALLIATLVLGGTCTTMTKSRSGQLTFGAVLGVYLIRRYRWKGIAAALLVSAPVLMLGGRSGDEASQSTMERLEAWSEGLKMLRTSPILGVGFGQFTEHHYLTAHSAFVLTLAELGPAGLVIFMSALYFAIKIVVGTYQDLADVPEAAPARTWAIALLALLAGTIVSAAFLSIPAHPLLWVIIGLTGALRSAVRSHKPDFDVRFGPKDLARVCGLAAGFAIFVAVYLRFKGM
jgi:hypothetical protein